MPEWKTTVHKQNSSSCVSQIKGLFIYRLHFCRVRNKNICFLTLESVTSFVTDPCLELEFSWWGVSRPPKPPALPTRVTRESVFIRSWTLGWTLNNKACPRQTKASVTHSDALQANSTGISVSANSSSCQPMNTWARRCRKRPVSIEHLRFS